MTLAVYWDGEEAGQLELLAERSREYAFHYTHASRPISLALPLRGEPFTPAESRPFFEGLLPEGRLREQIASQLKLAASDTYGLLAQLGSDCAGALQIAEAKRMSEPPSVQWLDAEELARLIEELPRHPLGVDADDRRLRLSLAGVQNKAVLLRAEDGTYGKPLAGMPSTHILKPELPGAEFPGIATNEYFCMRLASRSGLPAATVELETIAGLPCLVVERFDRDLTSRPPRRVHQEDLCQALGLTPDFKYQHEGWQVPSYRALAQLLDEHSPTPGADRLAAAQAAVFNFLVGNADAHAKNISLIHSAAGVRLAPLYDVVSTAVYPGLTTKLALAIGDEHDPGAITTIHWQDLAQDFGLNARAFEHARKLLAERVASEARHLRAEALATDLHDHCIEKILEVIAARAELVR